MTTPHGSLLRSAFDQQIEWCERLGSPFMVRLLVLMREHLCADAALSAELLALTPDPKAALLPLRLAGALHDLALRGRQPWAALWPRRRRSDQDLADDDELAAAVARAMATERGHLLAFARRAPQTNEVRRCALLLPGWLFVAQRTGLPLALLELGASAGLNLWADRWQHEHGAWSWPGAAGALRLSSQWRGAPPPLPQTLHIASRQGCDLAPVDLADAGERRRLAAYVWPDQRERAELLQAALAVAPRWMAQEQVQVQPRDAVEFVQSELQTPRPGCATLVYHSVVWQYMAAAERQALTEAIEHAGARASAEAPLAWLSFEHPRSDAPGELRCRLWPGGHDELLATAHPHGAWIEWRA